ncbi:hypothetical protein ACQJBY_039131 [Aegilops geniculata]
MNCLRNSRSVFSRLMALRQAPRSRSHVLNSIRRLFNHPAKPATSCLTPAPSLPAAVPRSQPSIHRARGWYRDPWKVAGASGAAVLLPYATVFTACAAVSHTETVPYTNRTHRVMFSPKLECKLGNEDFEELKKKRSKDILGPSDPKTVRVRHIASDIIRGIQELFPADGLGDDNAKKGKASVRSQTGHLDDLQWEVIVIRDNRVNACSLGGGKIVVFTGLLNFLETDAEIAAIIAHEAAHAVARHSMELAMLTPPILNELLPFSRRTELEADLIGMMILAAAGFDPRVAPEIHQKRESTMLRTVLDDYIGSHPSCKKRSQVLSRGDAMKEAMELYYKQVCSGKGADRRFPYGGRFSDALMSQ